MTMITTVHDSTKETTDHIERVRGLLRHVTDELFIRGEVHDRSKLDSFEKEHFDAATGKLRALTYGTPEYKEALKELGPALDHHYKNNSHHPEHYENGISGMSLLDIVEMICDWKAATERHADGSLEKSIKFNRERFKYPELLEQIFENTRREMGW